MKNFTTIFIALFTIASSFANNTNPAAATSLSASVNNNTVVLNFAANSNFEIERSFYSNEFTTIATVNNASCMSSFPRIAAPSSNPFQH